MYQTQLRWQPIAVLLIIAMIWGSNMALIKVAARDLAPMFMAGIRSLVASICLYIWMRARGLAFFPSKTILVHGIVIGLMFGFEFGLIFIGLNFTLASRGYVLLYIAPFIAALGAHIFLINDRLNFWKVFGLILAFSGVVVLFVEDLGAFSFRALPGDLLFLIAGATWGATTVYIKKYLAYRAEPLQILFYQLLFSAPFLLTVSIVFEHPIITGFSPLTGFSLFYQCIIVAFLSYLGWFVLVARYPVSLLHAFSFFTPVFGVIFSGILILGEVISPNLIMALILVSLGMVLVNHRPTAA
ncbi:MAG: DMT family transporter [Desulfobacterales bacterium]|nr:DMT family transporter [Deltaproteobacteria bacterium]NNL74901.1 DMT family transporter [Desulfobacterales bacterium]